MADWEEIKRLAADFQRAQLSSTVQRLSERNCIEIVQKLIDQKLVDELIYTTDGKEYLTSQEILKEIREELTVHGGHINLVDLQQAINIDFSYIESKVKELVQGDRNLNIALGQLIDVDYLNNLAEEINVELQEKGQVTLADLTITYDLPSEFLSEVIYSRIGKIIHGKVDEFDRDVIFTDSYVKRFKAKICGLLRGVTKPTTLMPIINSFGIQERLFYTITEELISSKQLAGIISQGRKDKVQFIPDIYTRSQNDWVDNFYKQNGYLEYDALTRLGIADPKGFIKKRFKNEHLIYLSTCCAGQAVEDRVGAEIEEALNCGSWVDIMSSVPSVFSENDINQIIQRCLKSYTGGAVFCGTIVASEEFIKGLCQPFEKIMAAKADKDAKTNPVLLAPEGSKKLVSKVPGSDDGSSVREEKKEQRRKKAAGGKAGGGTQGREVKTKSTKKKGHKGRGAEEDPDDEGASCGRGGSVELDFLSLEEIEEELQKNKLLRDCPEEFISEIANTLYRPLRYQYQEVAKSVFLNLVGSGSSQARKKTHGELQEKINGLWVNVKMFEKGVKYFTGDTLHQLNRHLLRTVCTDITNLVFNAITAEQMVSVSEETPITPEVRLKLLSKIAEDEDKQILSKLHMSLNNKTLEEFYHQLELICSAGHLEILLKKPDKKKERQLIFNHRQALIEQIHNETDPAMTLHLAAVLLFQLYTQNIIHAPGKCVPQILSYLKEHVSKENHEILTQFQDLVVMQLKRQIDEEKESVSTEEDASYSREGVDDILSQLHELLPKIKEIALNSKKQTSQDAE